jgi:hypothetical protein
MSVPLWMMKQDEGTCNLREIALNLHAPMHARSTMSLRLLVTLVNPIFEPTCLLVLRWLVIKWEYLFANRPADLLGVVPTVGMYSQLFLLY